MRPQDARHAAGPVQALLIAVTWILLPLPVSANLDVDQLGTWIEQARRGEFTATRDALRAERDAAFPGITFSGETCRDRPDYALMVAAERKLVAKDKATAANYLRQLQCLFVARDESRPPRARLDAIERLELHEAQRVNECPKPLGMPFLERATRALQRARVDAAWREWLQAACLLGLRHGEVGRLRVQLLATPEDAEIQYSIAEPESAAAEPPRPLEPPLIEHPQPAPVPQPSGVAPPTPTPSVRPRLADDAVRTRSEHATLQDRIARQTTPGEIAFNPPQTMRLNQAERIEVRIQPGAVATEGMVGAGAIQVESIPVTSSMTVKLCCGPPAEDHPFDIIGQSSERQVVDSSGFTQWVFAVTPRKSGVHTLTLTVAAQFRFPNGDVIAKDYPVKIKEIRVEVDTSSRFAVVLGVATVLLFGPVFWVWRRARRQPAGTQIFVSYRRDDSGGWVQTLHDRLAAHFGDANVFMDLQDISPGSDFVTTLDDSLKNTRVMLVVIGRHWLDAANSSGERRLDNPTDWVRLEIKAGLTSGKQVIPVLVNDAAMPPPERLPEDIRALARHQGVKLYPDQFAEGVARLIRAIEAGR